MLWHKAIGAGGVGGGGPATLTFIGTSDYGASGTSHTYTSVDIGTATSDRIVIVVVHATGNTSGTTVTGVTLGGTSMTSAIATTNSFSTGSIHYLEVASGTSATIVASYSSLKARGTIAVYTLTDWSSATPSYTDSSTGTSTTRSVNMDIPTGSVAVYGLTAQASTVTSSYSDATETYDGDVGGAGTTTASGAYLYDAGTAHTETVTLSASQPGMLLGAVWS